jgi:hypothetical protein
VNVALVAPAATVTVGGTVATAASLLARPITAPPCGALAVRVTVPDDEVAPVRAVGLKSTMVSAATFVVGVMNSWVDLVAPSKAAKMITEVIQADGFGSVETVKVALKDPSGTVTTAGTLASQVLLLDSATVTPPAGAGFVRVTYPVEGVPPATLSGSRLIEASGECWKRPVGFHDAPPSVLLNTPMDVPA